MCRYFLVYINFIYKLYTYMKIICIYTEEDKSLRYVFSRINVKNVIQWIQNLESLECLELCY